jgi:hypothetical protein
MGSLRRRLRLIIVSVCLLIAVWVLLEEMFGRVAAGAHEMPPWPEGVPYTERTPSWLQTTPTDLVLCRTDGGTNIPDVNICRPSNVTALHTRS